MENQFFQIPAQSITGAMVILILFLISLGPIYAFISALLKKNKNVDIKTPFGSVSTTDKNYSKNNPAVHVNVNTEIAPNENAITKKTVLSVENACDDGLERYNPPEGLPSFKEHRFFKLTTKILDGKRAPLKSKSKDLCGLTDIEEIKNKAFSYFLYDCKTRVFKDMLENFVDDCLCQVGNRYVLASIIKRTINAVKEYEERARGAHINIDDNRVLLGIPETMIKKFNEWHTKHIDIILNRLEAIIESQFYHSWQLKLISILDTFEIIFIVTYKYAEYSLVDLNGELNEALEKNIVYRSLNSEKKS